MRHGLRLVHGGRGRQAVRCAPAPVTPQQREARALVEAWLDAPSYSVAHAVEDLVARIAAALEERDGRETSTAPLSS